MSEKILLGRGSQIIEVPQEMWKKHLKQIPDHSQERLKFMTEAHHKVRNFIVKAMVIQQTPIKEKFIAKELNIPVEMVNKILEELQENLFFLVRDEEGAVIWAYPVTIVQTPHMLCFDTGERLYAAWAEDAIAAPFVQGHLRNEYVSITIKTKCSHCEQRMHISIDSNWVISTREQESSPLVFMPDINWNSFKERTIIDAYWRNSIFFWSEEHAREYRLKNKQGDGIYLTLGQCAYMTPITQGALFPFH
jgi:Alkylmercury lyase